MERTCDFIRTLTQLYRRLHGWQTRIFQFSSTMRGGKLAIADLPPLSSAVNLIFQFSSAARGGKQAIATLPPLPSAVKSIFQLSSALRGGNLKLHLRCGYTWRKSFNPIFVLFSLLLLVGGSRVGA
ncbi:hypothetical protein AAC387_Pa03g0672 [Persea americana]